MFCIVSAFDKEIEPLISELEAVEVEGSHWIVPSRKLVIAAVGVGYLEAAIGLEKLLVKYPETTGVLFTGSAGVYPGVSSVTIGELVVCKDTMLCDGTAELGLGLYATIMEKGPYFSSLPMTQSLKSARVATLLALTKDNQLATTIQRNSEAELENMELFGIAQVCEQRSLPWNALVGITNTVGEEGHVQWKQNYRKVAQLAGRELIKLIKVGEFSAE